MLEKADTSPDYLLKFYEELIKAEIYILIKTVETNDSILIDYWMTAEGKIFIPIFSSINKIKQFTKNEASYLTIDARTFFQKTLGNTMIINPVGDCSKE